MSLCGRVGVHTFVFAGASTPNGWPCDCGAEKYNAPRDLTPGEERSLEKIATLRGRVGLLKRSIEQLPRWDYESAYGPSCLVPNDGGDWISRADVLALFAVVNEP